MPSSLHTLLCTLLTAGLFSIGALSGATPVQAQSNPDFSLAANGVTVLCADAAVGDTGDVGGTTYTKRDRSGLDDLLVDDENNPAFATTCTSDIGDMSDLFNSASTFNQDISSWDVSSVTTMQGMFNDASAFNQDIGAWDVSSVTTTRSMFRRAVAFNQDISGWTVSAVTNMQGMFRRADAFNQDIGGWAVLGVENMSQMFQEAGNFNQNIGGWTVSSVTTMRGMFRDASSFNQDIGGWVVSSVTDMGVMFSNAGAFDQDISGWDVSGVTGMDAVFNNSGLSATNYDRILIGWAGQALNESLSFGANTIEYCNSGAFREHITQAYGWTFNGDTRATGCPGAVLAGTGSANVSADGLATLGDADAQVNFDGVSGSGRVTAARFNDMPRNVGGVTEANISPYRLVIVAEDGLTFSGNTEVRFDETSFSGISNPNDITVYSRSVPGTGNFASLTTTFDATRDEIVANTGSFSELIFASDTNPLPVELTNFTATRSEGSVSLQWATVSETNNAGFDVQRTDGSADAVSGNTSWTTLGFVEGAGTTDQPQSYTFTAEDISVGTHAFRLRQVDTDGTESFSEPVEVNVTLDAAYALSNAYPNPVRSAATLDLTVQQTQPVTATVYDMLGRQVMTLHSGEITANTPTVLRLNAERLSSGTYFVRVNGESFKVTRRLTVVR